MAITLETCEGQYLGITHPAITHDEISCPVCVQLMSVVDEAELVEDDLRYGGINSMEATREALKELRAMIAAAFSKAGIDPAENPEAAEVGYAADRLDVAISEVGTSIDHAISSLDLIEV